MPGSPIGQQHVSANRRLTGQDGSFGCGVMHPTVGMARSALASVADVRTGCGVWVRLGVDVDVGVVTLTGTTSVSRGIAVCFKDRFAEMVSLAIGDGRPGKSRRCALPTTAFFEMPKRRPISAVECP